MILRMYHTYARRATSGCMLWEAGTSRPSALSYHERDENGVSLDEAKGGGSWRQQTWLNSTRWMCCAHRLSPAQGARTERRAFEWSSAKATLTPRSCSSVKGLGSSRSKRVGRLQGHPGGC